MAKLKVFCWSDGFHAYPVAVSSRPKALEAWGVTQDLFMTGMAVELTEGADFEAALANPGQVLERKIDIQVSGPAAQRQTKPKARAKSPAAPAPAAKAVVRKPPPGPTKAQVAKAERLEAALRSLETRQAAELKAAEAAVTRAEAALDQARSEQRALASRHRKARDTAEAALSGARGALRG